ncbi:Metalloreductase STEAP3 [Tetrabaena socialis]|uniref:Metalloreductase STEAP3 n=1 Tax=Tetrabaena socialis TaxID=47790 RepID=A0A2J7ZZV8_9CHLO|nr:Metalloreductase STEAP3 [Tetrabaena socialis]|eukprot:PNH05802.1 Metalloreductase STEAP3 [Tetrabaena socialis]
MPLTVGIVGAGTVGKTLGSAIARTNKVVFGVRDPAKYAQLSTLKNTSVASVSDAIKASDVIILATPGSNDDAGIKSTAASLGPGIAGKVLIDATNPLTSWPGLEVRWTAGTSGGEVLAAVLPDTIVYKAFNTIGVNQMSHADGSAITGQQLTMLFAGGPAQREAAEEVISAVGFKPEYVGPIRYARNLEAIAELWIHLSVPGVGTAEKWGRDFHFQTIRK